MMRDQDGILTGAEEVWKRCWGCGERVDGAVCTRVHTREQLRRGGAGLRNRDAVMWAVARQNGKPKPILQNPLLLREVLR